MNTKETQASGELLSSPAKEREQKFSQTQGNDGLGAAHCQQSLNAAVYYEHQSNSFWVQEGDTHSTIYRKFRRSDLLNICLTKDSRSGGPPRQERRHDLDALFASFPWINCVGPRGVLRAELREKNGERLLIRPFPGYAEGPGVKAWRRCFRDHTFMHENGSGCGDIAQIIIQYGLYAHIPQIVHELVIFRWFDRAYRIGALEQAQYEHQLRGYTLQINREIRELARI